MKDFKTIDLNNDLSEVNKQLSSSADNVNSIIFEGMETQKDLNDLLERVQNLAKINNLKLEEIIPLDNVLEIFNLQLDEYLFDNSNSLNNSPRKFPKMSNIDVVVCGLSSVLSILIDVIFVGTPEVVKVYKGGEKFDGSILTSILRKMGKNDDGKISPILQWFSDKCKVPYDISIFKDTLTPNNHRLRNFAHDPLFGLLFAVADIILGTTTCIDNKGHLKILVNKRKAPTTEKWLAVIYYFGHLISDVCTSRGLPIPGFCFLQFFQTKIGDETIAKIAENMYKDGYDLRHMLSMGVPVFVKDKIINLYLSLTIEVPDAVSTLSEREKYDLDNKLKAYKMKFISNTAATLGNTLKFLAPPSCGNPTAINLVQWVAFLQSGMAITNAGLRDTSVEETMHIRNIIDAKWEELLRYS